MNQFDKSIHQVVLFLHIHENICNREKERKSRTNYQGVGRSEVVDNKTLVVIQPYILVSKLKKIKTKFLRCTGYLNSIKNPIKQDLLQILVLVRQQNFLNC